MIEVWRAVVGYEGVYEVSNWGRVKSLWFGKERILKPHKNKNGYLTVLLSKNKKITRCYIHRLVAQAFIPNPQNLSEINHKNEQKELNFVENLEWCDHRYNMRYGTRIERVAKANAGVYNTKCSKPVVQKTKDGEFVREWPSLAEINRQTGWSIANISQCCNGILKSSHGYRWSYSTVVPS